MILGVTDSSTRRDAGNMAMESSWQGRNSTALRRQAAASHALACGSGCGVSAGCWLLSSPSLQPLNPSFLVTYGFPEYYQMSCQLFAPHKEQPGPGGEVKSDMCSTLPWTPHPASLREYLAACSQVGKIPNMGETRPVAPLWLVRAASHEDALAKFWDPAPGVSATISKRPLAPGWLAGAPAGSSHHRAAVPAVELPF